MFDAPCDGAPSWVVAVSGADECPDSDEAGGAASALELEDGFDVPTVADYAMSWEDAMVALGRAGVHLEVAPGRSRGDRRRRGHGLRLGGRGLGGLLDLADVRLLRKTCAICGSRVEEAHRREQRRVGGRGAELPLGQQQRGLDRVESRRVAGEPALCTGMFTSGQETEIAYAANSWDAGAGTKLRGALFDFIRGSDRAYNACTEDNGYNEVYVRNDDWFDDAGLPAGTIAACRCQDYTSNNDNDVVFNSTITWTTSVPSLAGSGEKSIGQTALHEFGHYIGLNHYQANGSVPVIATMNNNYPFGGDLSGIRYTPNEDDYVGLVYGRGDSSTGSNLLLSKFELSSGTAAHEVWDDKTSKWTVCDQIVSSADHGPEPILAVIEGTTVESPVIDWWLSADHDCDTGTAWAIGSRTPTIGANTPYAVQPTNYDFRGIPAGDYYVCAMIDPDDLITESTSAQDNDLTSSVTLTVQDCP